MTEFDNVVIGKSSVPSFVIAVILMIATLRPSQGSSPFCLRIKNESLDWDSFFMARCEGLEPPTSWFVARHSIQLS